MSNDKVPPDKRPPSGPAPDTTIVQKVLGKTVLALESTMTRLRRLQHTEDVRAGRSAPATPDRPARTPPGPAPPRAAPPAPAPARPAAPLAAKRDATDARAPVQPATQDPAAGKPATGASGRVGHDSRGNAIWNWATHALESTSRLLKRLEAPELSLDDKPKSGGLELEERDPGGGYDPYSKGGRGGGAGFDPYSKGSKQRKP